MQPASAFCHSAKLLVCQSNVFCESVYYQRKIGNKKDLSNKEGKERLEADMSKASYKSKKGRKVVHSTDSVFLLPTLYHEQGYTQSVRGLLGGEARRVSS